MTTKKIRISVYLDPALKTRLEALAKSKRRSLNNLIESSMEEIEIKEEKLAAQNHE